MIRPCRCFVFLCKYSLSCNMVDIYNNFYFDLFQSLHFNNINIHSCWLPQLGVLLHPENDIILHIVCQNRVKTRILALYLVKKTLLDFWVLFHLHHSSFITFKGVGLGLPVDSFAHPYSQILDLETNNSYSTSVEVRWRNVFCLPKEKIMGKCPELGFQGEIAKAKNTFPLNLKR